MDNSSKTISYPISCFCPFCDYYVIESNVKLEEDGYGNLLCPKCAKFGRHRIMYKIFEKVMK